MPLVPPPEIGVEKRKESLKVKNAEDGRIPAAYSFEHYLRTVGLEKKDGRILFFVNWKPCSDLSSVDPFLVTFPSLAVENFGDPHLSASVNCL
jgi:hypothetical protein